MFTGAREKRHVPFQGVGRILGSSSFTVTGPAMASTAPTPSVNVAVDESLMTTSFQLRMADGTRLIGRFIYHHTISGIHYWVWFKGVEMSTYPLLGLI